MQSENGKQFFTASRRFWTGEIVEHSNKPYVVLRCEVMGSRYKVFVKPLREVE